MNKTELVAVSKLKPNPNNPRVIRDEKFKKLVKSIQDFPRMMELRPIVVNDKMEVLGGNMRLRAVQDLGLKEVPVIKASDLTEDQQKEFIIKDNVGFGDWDWDVLANEWEPADFEDWGLDVPSYMLSDQRDLDGFFENSNEPKKDESFKIILEYNENDFNAVNEALKKHSGSKEQVFYQLLGL